MGKERFRGFRFGGLGASLLHEVGRFNLGT